MQEKSDLVRFLPSLYRSIYGKSVILTRMIFPSTINNFGSGSNGAGDINVLPCFVSSFTKKIFLVLAFQFMLQPQVNKV